MTITEQLNQPFPYQAYRCNYENQLYISVNWIVERLNVVLDCNWTHEIIEFTERLEDHSVEVFGKLSIYDKDKEKWISRYQLGNDTMTLKKHTQELTPQARMDCKKSAVSDCLKKTAALFGAGLDVYKNIFQVIEPNNPLYISVQNEFPHLVDTNGSHKYGIPVLPDHYKEYYENNNLEGIFVSDIAQMKSQQQHKPQQNTQQAQQTRSTSRQSSSSSSTSPTPYRIKVNSAPTFTQDNSSTFNAIMEDRSEILVIAHKNLAESVKSITHGDIINITGWLKSGKLTIMHSKGLTIEDKTKTAV